MFNSAEISLQRRLFYYFVAIRCVLCVIYGTTFFNQFQKTIFIAGLIAPDSRSRHAVTAIVAILSYLLYLLSLTHFRFSAGALICQTKQANNQSGFSSFTTRHLRLKKAELVRFCPDGFRRPISTGISSLADLRETPDGFCVGSRPQSGPNLSDGESA